MTDRRAAPRVGAAIGSTIAAAASIAPVTSEPRPVVVAAWIGAAAGTIAFGRWWA